MLHGFLSIVQTKQNALSQEAFQELQAAIEHLDDEPECRVIVLTGEGKHFCSGIDLTVLMTTKMLTADACSGRSGEKVRRFVKVLQAPIDAIEACSKPVIAAIHGGCIGAGLDLVAGCDMRYMVDDSYCSIREIDMGMVADLGSLQRLPKLLPQGIVRELAYTGRNVNGPEAVRIGLANQSYPSRETMLESVGGIASVIASKSPLSIRGNKRVLLHSRDHSVADGLEYIAAWNAGMLVSEDLEKSFEAFRTKEKAEFRG